MNLDHVRMELRQKPDPSYQEEINVNVKQQKSDRAHSKSDYTSLIYVVNTANKKVLFFQRFTKYIFQPFLNNFTNVD